MSIPAPLNRRTAYLIHHRTSNAALRRATARWLTDDAPKPVGKTFEDLSAAQQLGAARAHGLIASHPTQVHTVSRTFGEAVANLNHDGNAAQQLALLPDLDVTLAARLIDTYMTRTASEHVGFNLYHLTDTLTNWDTSSRKARAHTLYDYYAGKR